MFMNQIFFGYEMKSYLSLFHIYETQYDVPYFGDACKTWRWLQCLVTTPIPYFVYLQLFKWKWQDRIPKCFINPSIGHEVIQFFILIFDHVDDFFLWLTIPRHWLHHFCWYCLEKEAYSSLHWKPIQCQYRGESNIG